MTLADQGLSQPAFMRQLAAERAEARARFERRVLEALARVGECDVVALCHALRIAIRSNGSHGGVRAALDRLVKRGDARTRAVEGRGRGRRLYSAARRNA